MKKTVTWLLSLVMLITAMNLPCFSISAQTVDNSESLSIEAEDDFSNATAEQTMPATVKLSATKAVYQGFEKSVVPDIIVKDNDGKAVDKSNYDIVMPKTVVAVGEYTYHVIFKNDYAGEKKLKFKIVPKKAAIKSVKTGSRKMKLTFSKKVSSTGGAYYEYSYRIKGTSKWKTVKTKKQTVTVSKLKKGKKYEVKVRAYKVVNKKKISGEWSKVKTTSKIK